MLVWITVDYMEIVPVEMPLNPTTSEGARGRGAIIL
jgi:hypothetical protein